MLKPWLSLVALLSASLVQAQPVSPASAPLRIVVSHAILADITREIAGPSAQITTLVGAGQDAHVYRATPNDAAKLKQAELILVSGLGFDPFMDRLVAASGSAAKILTYAQAITPLPAPAENARAHNHGHGKAHAPGSPAYDPHFWQSPRIVQAGLPALTHALSALRPQEAAAFAARAATYSEKLTALSAKITQLLAPIPPEKRLVVTNHDSMGYFAAEFGVTFHTLQGLSTQSEASARDVARIITLVRAKKARAVFVENLSSPRLIEQVARESGAKIGGVLFTDTLSDDKGPAPTYIALMEHNARLIAAALAE